MSTFRCDPYLLIHLAGIAAAPLALELVWLGLAIGDPLSYWFLEFFLVALVGLVPIFLMQTKKHFNIYSLLLWHLRLDSLTTEQRQVLALFKRPRQTILTISLTGMMLVILWYIYQQAPLASGLAEQFFPPIRILGLVIAAFSFLAANLFIQVALSTLLVMLTNKEDFQNVSPWAQENLAKDFTVFGLAVRQIIPNWQ